MKTYKARKSKRSGDVAEKAPNALTSLYAKPKSPLERGAGRHLEE
jgi:hypothetical protein